MGAKSERGPTLKAGGRRTASRASPPLDSGDEDPSYTVETGSASTSDCSVSLLRSREDTEGDVPLTGLTPRPVLILCFLSDR